VPRATRELVVLVLAFTACGVVLASVVGLIAVELFHPETETAPGWEIVWSVAGLMFGAVAGYLFAMRARRS
jgi:hypothetical protein